MAVLENEFTHFKIGDVVSKKKLALLLPLKIASLPMTFRTCMGNGGGRRPPEKVIQPATRTGQGLLARFQGF